MRKVRKTSTLVNILLAAIIISIIFIYRVHYNGNYQWFQVVFSVNFGYLTFKIVTSFLYKTIEEVGEGSELPPQITAIIPCYNESLAAVEKAIHSLLKQTVQVDEIIFIDDGSESQECFEFLTNYPNQSIRIITHRFDENQGKKAALLWGINHAKGDLLLMLDSDGELVENAVEELRKPFQNSKVGTVCGRVMPRNYQASFLTRVQNIVYFNAFEVGRASQSIFKDVVVASGALSMHRKEIFTEEALEVFQKERFFGLRCIAGDDRLLTDISKEHDYQSMYQNSAICYTDVPETLPKYFKQQVRWLKSAYLQSLYSLRHSWRKPMLMLYQMLEAYLWLINLVLTLVIVFTNGISVTPRILLFWIIYALLVSSFNSIKFRQYGFLRYLVSIFYSFVYGLLIFVMRIYALLTIGKTGWNTR